MEWIFSSFSNVWGFLFVLQTNVFVVIVLSRNNVEYCALLFFYLQRWTINGDTKL